MPAKRRLIIVSYRLPFNLVRENNKFQLVQNSGGLVSAILSFSEKEQNSVLQELFSKILWFGYSEFSARDYRRAHKQEDLFELHPVALEESVNQKFYAGFSNDLLWPLLHYFPTFAVFDDSYFEDYVRANFIFSEAIRKEMKPNDLIWIHDYHFFLLPQMIRKQEKKATIGFFLHVPFPSFEIFRLLPHRIQQPLLKGMLGADLIGFHTLDYVYHFLKTVRKVLDVEHANRMMFFNERKIKAEAFPISIDYQKFRDATLRPAVQKEIQNLKEVLGDQKLIFSVDRLDYSKGLVNRLQGFEYFLKEHPEWHGKVMFQMVVIPSRDTIPQYQEMRNQIDALAGRINSKYNTLQWRPIVYQYKSLRFEEMIALYDLSDVGLITPIRDGMNLVAKEYVASQRSTSGVLILSEMAGAAAELRDAIIVNPTDQKEIGDAIVQALTMPEEERKQRMKRMQKRLQEYDVTNWTIDFIHQLTDMRQINRTESSNLITAAVVRSITGDYHRANRRVLLLDYDGTLVPLQSEPQQATPGNDVIAMLKDLGSDSKNVVVLISGRDKTFLEKWFGNLPVILVAEHGAFTKIPGSQWIRITSEDEHWKNSIINELQLFSLKFPGSMLEIKEQSVAFHYRNAPDITPKEITYLKNILEPLIKDHDLQILEGNKVIEVKHFSFNKGTAVQQFLSLVKEDFMLAIGDDKTDEDLFRSLPQQAYTLKVGEPSSTARYYIRNPGDVIQLLTKLLQPVAV